MTLAFIQCAVCFSPMLGSGGECFSISLIFCANLLSASTNFLCKTVCAHRIAHVCSNCRQSSTPKFLDIHTQEYKIFLIYKMYNIFVRPRSWNFTPSLCGVGACNNIRSLNLNFKVKMFQWFPHYSLNWLMLFNMLLKFDYPAHTVYAHVLVIFDTVHFNAFVFVMFSRK